MNHEELNSLLAKISRAKIGIVGDFCLDAYLLLEPNASESSLETGLSTRPVRSQRYSLGGAGNVTNNLQAMGVTTLSVFGVLGRDPFGEEMRRIFTSKDIDTRGLLMQQENWDTHVYMKPYEREQEQHRLDFGDFNQLQPSTRELLLEKLEAALPRLDIVIVNQQVRHGIHTSEFRGEVRALITRHPERPFIVDSRHYTDDFSGAMRKLNILEGAKLYQKESVAPDLSDPKEMEELARRLFERWGKPVFLTRGQHGCVVFDGRGFKEIPGLLILSPVDTVGAGDSMLAGIAAALAVGVDPHKAAEFGSFVAGVTVQKLMQTGTASPEEILKIGTDPDRLYRPALAQRQDKAVFHADTEIEIVSSLPQLRRFTHVIFDHDGTLSTLRQGWEEVMEPMMVNTILGKGQREADEALYANVLATVRDYIDKTTGIQTLVQMKGLVNLVRQFKCVPENDILDGSEYKEIYSDCLLRMVNDRIRKIERGDLSVDDFSIKKAVHVLKALHQKGVTLYLASGTDQADVEREAGILGYRSFFDNRIYGAVGDITKEAKRMVLERILGDIGDEEPERILTFGDGPVEIRETHKRGGYSVGVASNEIRRHGLNLAKRRRLIEAGADLIIPDFCQMDQLLSLLFE